MSHDLPIVRGEDQIAASENELLSKALAVASKGQSLLFERLDQMEDQHLVAATQMAARVVSAKRRWKDSPISGEGFGIAALAERLKDMPAGTKLTLSCEMPRPEDQAIDVTPQWRADSISPIANSKRVAR